MAAAGELHGPAVVVGDSQFCVGDRVMATRNRRRLGVVNGARGTVTQVDPDAAEVVVRLDAGDVVILPGDYVASGQLTHAYASTVHKAQGMTCDRSLVLADDRLFLESGYTALSRGREANALYVVRSGDEGHRPSPAPVQMDDVAAQLRRSMAKELATETRGADVGGY